MQTRQEFILKTLQPYFDDPKLCSFNEEFNKCAYLSPNGNKCAFGKHIAIYRPEYECNNAYTVLRDFEDALTNEAKEQNLNGIQWDSIQAVHDKLVGVTNYKDIWTKYTLLQKIEECENICDVDLSILKQYKFD